MRARANSLLQIHTICGTLGFKANAARNGGTIRVWTNKQLSCNLTTMTSIVIKNKEDILAQIASGKLLHEVAKQYGISKQAIHQRIGKDPEYREALKAQCQSLIEEAKTLTWAAREGIDIARAREISKWAFRYAESMDAGTWGQRGNQLNINANGPVSIEVVSYQDTQEKPAIEHDPGE